VGQEDLLTSIDTEGDEVVVTVRGEVDLVSSPELRRVLDESLTRSSRVRVDLTGLTFIDSSGLSALVEAHRNARDAGGVLVLQNPTSMFTRLLDITKLDTLLVVEPSDAGPAVDPE
jgi:anti-sigma B factor antagonist